MMNFRAALRNYGRNDNSVTDCMYYEDAIGVCGQLSALTFSTFTSSESVAAIESGLTKNLKAPVPNVRETAEAIAARLDTLRAPMGSRIMVEFVRQKINEFHQSREAK